MNVNKDDANDTTVHDTGKLAEVEELRQQLEVAYKQIDELVYWARNGALWAIDLYTDPGRKELSRQRLLAGHEGAVGADAMLERIDRGAYKRKSETQAET